MSVGIIVRAGSMWIGFHYSKNHKRLCINLVPCVTLWIVGQGGDIPRKEKM